MPGSRVNNPGGESRPGGYAVHRFLITAMCMAASACTVAPPASNYQPVRGDTAFPAIGRETVAGIGEDLLRKGQYTQTAGIELPEGARILKVRLSPGFYPEIGEDETYSYHSYRTAPAGEGIGYIPPTRDSLGAWLPAPDAVRADKNGQEVCLIYESLGARPCTGNVAFTKVSRQSLGDHDLLQKLIYDGVSDGRIKLRYWEKSGHFARPEATTELEFALKPFTEIAYKGARIRILEADGEKVRFVVLETFPDY